MSGMSLVALFKEHGSVGNSPTPAVGFPRLFFRREGIAAILLALLAADATGREVTAIRSAFSHCLPAAGTVATTADLEARAALAKRPVTGV